MRSKQPGQRVLQCRGSAKRWLLLISATMASKLSGEAGFELRGVVKPLVFFCSHLALLPRCHLFIIQKQRHFLFVSCNSVPRINK